jgi:hypothetical protein
MYSKAINCLVVLVQIQSEVIARSVRILLSEFFVGTVHSIFMQTGDRKRVLHCTNDFIW